MSKLNKGAPMSQEKRHVLKEGIKNEKTPMPVEGEVTVAAKSEQQLALEIMLGVNEKPVSRSAQSSIVANMKEESPLLQKAKEFRNKFEQIKEV